MKRQPLTRQRSAWVETRPPVLPATWRVFERAVHDGKLRSIITNGHTGWHLSISWSGASAAARARYPTWDEIADARERLLPSELCFAMHLPPADQYVALHDTTFHLHECPAGV